MEYKHNALIVILLLLVCACKNEPETIVFLKNSTEDTIAVAHPFMENTDNIEGHNFSIETKETNYLIYLCPPNMRHAVYGWFDKDKENAFPLDSFVFYVMSAHIAHTCTWDSISNYNLADYKYVLSFDNLVPLKMQ